MGFNFNHPPTKHLPYLSFLLHGKMFCNDSVPEDVNYANPTEFLYGELKAGTIALVKAEYLFKLCQQNHMVPSYIELMEREKEAFIDVDCFKQDHGKEWCSQIVVISYMTLGRDHPDPDGWTLRQVVRALELFRREFKGRNLKECEESIGVFWDYLSLGSRRTSNHQRFDRGLRYVLPLLYMHPQTTVFEATKHPSEHHHSAGEHQKKAYWDRGWPFAEAAWGSYCKQDCSRVFAISNLEHGAKCFSDLLLQCSENVSRTPPSLPSEFKNILESKSWSRRDYDLPRVSSIVDKAHTLLVDHLLGNVKQLSYERQGWGDNHAEPLFKLLQHKAPNLCKLDLSHNLFLDCFGKSSLFPSLFSACTNLTDLNLSGNPIGSDGIVSMADEMFRLRRLQLCKIGLDEHGCCLLAARILDALNNKSMGLDAIDISNNSVGDVGLAFMAPALVHIRNVKLQSANITDTGCWKLHDAAFKDEEVWDSMDLSGNSIEFAGALMSLFRKCNCNKLSWSDNPISGRSRWHLNQRSRCDGTGFEENIVAGLESGAVKLVSAKWLVSWSKSGRPIPRRQDLEELEEAGENGVFFCRDGLKKAAMKHGGSWCHNVVALSHMWLNEYHPDPLCMSLRTLVQALECLMAEFDFDFAVFWDFVSLHQKRNGLAREGDESRLFKEGLGVIPYIFMNPYTIVFQITELPRIVGYPLVGHSELPFMQRGWPFTEYSWSSIRKEYSGSVFNISKLGDGRTYQELYHRCAEQSRHIPLLPNEFNERAATLMFGEDEDRDNAKKVYRESFEKLFRVIGSLNLENLKWKNEDSARLLKMADSDCFKQLECLNMSRNQLTARLCSGLTGLVTSGRLRNLKDLDLSLNPLEDCGVALLGDLLFHPKLKCVRLKGVGLTQEGCRLLRAQFEKAVITNVVFVELDLSENNLGNIGVEMIAPFVTKARHLKLNSVGLTDNGCTLLHRFVQQGTDWKVLELRNNNITIAGPLIDLVKKSSDKPKSPESGRTDSGVGNEPAETLETKALEKLLISGNPIRHRSRRILEEFCNEEGIAL